MCLCVRYVDIVINVTADIKVSKYLSSIYRVDQKKGVLKKRKSAKVGVF